MALSKCLDLLKEGVQLLDFDQYEVIVTDDGPAFDVVNQLQYPAHVVE